MQRAVGRARCRYDDIEGPERDVAIDLERRGEPEGADAADRMAGQGLDLFGAKHARLAAERGLGLPVVEAGVAAGDDQHDLVADAQRQGLGDLARLHPMRSRGKRHGGAALFGDDNGDVGRVLGEEGADGFEAHRAMRAVSNRISRPAIAGTPKTTRKTGASSMMV